MSDTGDVFDRLEQATPAALFAACQQLWSVILKCEYGKVEHPLDEAIKAAERALDGWRAGLEWPPADGPQAAEDKQPQTKET